MGCGAVFSNGKFCVMILDVYIAIMLAWLSVVVITAAIRTIVQVKLYDRIVKAIKVLFKRENK